MTAQPAAALSSEAIMATVGITPPPNGNDGRGDGDEWDGDPVPLTTARIRRAFPVDALPAWVADYVAAIAEEKQVPLDLPASLALACLSTAAGGKALVQPHSGWTEPVNLYTAVALPPGERKTPTFRAMTAPIEAAENALRAAIQPQKIEAELSARVAHARADQLAKTAETATTNPHEAMAEATAAAEEAARITIPDLPRLTTDDVTPESCISLMAANGGRIAVLSAEDAFASISGTRYAAQANLGVWLKGHGGDRIQVDRRGRESETIDRPALTLGIATQPDTLAALAGDGMRARGVPARVLYSLPASNLGGRKPTGDPAPEPVTRAYHEHLTTLVLSLADLDEPAVLTLDHDAQEVLTGLLTWIEPHLAPGTGQFAGIADWAAKWAGHVLRIAALIHLADTLRTGYTTPITAATMHAAETIGRYYLDHALAAFDLMGASHDPALDDAQRVLDWITRTRAATFTRRDLFAGIRSQRFARVTDLDPALDVLTDHGHIRHQHIQNPKGGRPSTRYEVHPTVHTTDRHDRPPEVL